MDLLINRNIIVCMNNMGISNNVVKLLVERYDNLADIFKIDKKDLYDSIKINSKQIVKLNDFLDNFNIERTLDTLYKNEINFITIYDKEYPEFFHNIYDRPYVIYIKGELKKEDLLSIGIVGSRRATSYGQWACEKFTKELVEMGVTITSGLALGIDRIAHDTAIKNNGRTIAVLGNGLDEVYPKKNKFLYDSIVDSGCIISEFPLGTKPYAYNFPRRNRIIAGMSLALVVVEAKVKSGSLITAHHCLDQGKDVFAIPGNISSIYSGGTNKLIKDGAIPLLDIEDMINEVKELENTINLNKNKKIDYSVLGDIEMSIVHAMLDGPIHCDRISQITKIDIGTVISILTILEIKGLVKEMSGNVYILV